MCSICIQDKVKAAKGVIAAIQAKKASLVQSIQLLCDAYIDLAYHNVDAHKKSRGVLVFLTHVLCACVMWFISCVVCVHDVLYHVCVHFCDVFISCVCVCVCVCACVCVCVHSMFACVFVSVCAWFLCACVFACVHATMLRC